MTLRVGTSVLSSEPRGPLPGEGRDTQARPRPNTEHTESACTMCVRPCVCTTFLLTGRKLPKFLNMCLAIVVLQRMRHRRLASAPFTVNGAHGTGGQGPHQDSGSLRHVMLSVSVSLPISHQKGEGSLKWLVWRPRAASGSSLQNANMRAPGPRSY